MSEPSTGCPNLGYVTLNCPLQLFISLEFLNIFKALDVYLHVAVHEYAILHDTYISSIRWLST